MTADHLRVATNLLEERLGKAGTWPAMVTCPKLAFAALHESGAYCALRHAGYNDAHWRTALRSIFVNATFA